MRVKAFNGKEVKSIRDLAIMVLNSQEEFLRFDLEYDEVLVLESKTVGPATEEVLHLHSISSIVSKDLEDVLEIAGGDGAAMEDMVDLGRDRHK